MLIILYIGIQSDPIIIFTDRSITTDEMAMDMLIKHIDALAIQHKAKLTYYRDGNKIPLHYEGFSCSN